MAQKVFGPIRGAGVQVIELEGQKSIEPGALGFVGYAGVLEKGPVGELITVLGIESARKKVGSLISDSLLPDAIEDYFDLAAGAGGMLLVRVTDGNELPAAGYRDFARTANVANIFARRAAKTPIATIEAKNGGRWGGKRSYYTDEFALAGDITETTITTGLTKFKKDEWKGGYVELNAVPNKRYPIVGNTAAGVITVASDQTMDTDLGASTDFRYYLVRENGEKALSVEFRDGEEDLDNEFSMRIYVDGTLVNTYGNLSTDPTNKRYWVNIVNNDDGNDEIKITDLFTGTHVANVRPANYYDKIASVTATLLTKVMFDHTVASPTLAAPTVALGTLTSAMLEQNITITMTSPTAFTAVSDRFGSLGPAGTVGTLYTPTNKWTPPFTITNGSPVLATGDVITIRYKPFEPGALVGGFVYPDKPNFKRTKFRIVANTHNTLTVADGSDMTVVATTNDEFMVEAPRALYDGRDGIADLTDSLYNQKAWDVDSSPFNRIEGRNLGLVKFATPGVTATAVQKAGVAYAAAKNHQYRYEIPSNIVNEDSADAYVNETLGRSDYAVVSFPSYVSVADPQGEQGALKLVSATGMIHGREARIANDYLGYHKAEAGIDVTLPEILKLPTGDKILNEELLNPRGINVIKKARGNFILWGDRSLWLDPTWKFKHQREQMSYYEHVLQESFDFVIFSLNSPETRALVKTAMISFFLPEYRKGALDNDFQFEEAAKIKIDAENNTAATKAQGDMFCDILLRLVDTVERLRIRIGKAGIFEATE